MPASKSSAKTYESSEYSCNVTVWATGRRGRIINLISLAILIIIGWIDYVTGYEFGFFIFYFIPVAISAWFVSRNSGVFMACASALIWYLSDKYTYHPYSKAYLIYWEMWMRLVSFLTTALTVSRIRFNLEREKELNTRLSHALQEIEELKCHLPECVACRLLREDPARWERLASSSARELHERDGISPANGEEKITPEE